MAFGNDLDPDSAARVFRSMLKSPATSYICEAHNALSAKIVQEAGFPAIWASGLTISAQAGLRDHSEATSTQLLDHLEFMADAVTVPIMVDGDTGHGNFNNFSRLVRKLEQRGIAAVCIEDKCFPKTNSFVHGTRQALAPIDEFSGKLKAGKDAQQNSEFAIIARVEAFIAGWGLDEALRRAHAYHAAGADGILIHSARSTPDEVLAFKAAWGDQCPVMIVPTKYYLTPSEVFEAAGFSMVIWANQILRSAIRAMRNTARRIYSDRHLLVVEDEIVTIDELFRLQGEDEFAAQEVRYLPRAGTSAQALILAASRGHELGELTVSRPKTMVPVGGVPLAQRIVDTYRRAGVQRITMVRGYAAAAVNLAGIAYADSPEWEQAGELASLARGLAVCDEAGDLIVSYGDVLFKRYIVDQLLETEADWSIAVDTHWRESVNRDREGDYVCCSAQHTRRGDYRQAIELRAVTRLVDESRTHGEWMGFLKIAGSRRRDLTTMVNRLLRDHPQGAVPDLLNALVASGESVRVIYSTGNWLDIDSVSDLIDAGGF